MIKPPASPSLTGKRTAAEVIQSITDGSTNYALTLLQNAIERLVELEAPF
jgi:hypothetical protein